MLLKKNRREFHRNPNTYKLKEIIVNFELRTKV